VLTVALLTGAATSVIGGGAKMVAEGASAEMARGPEAGPMMGPDHGMGYFVDGMFRGDKPAADDREARMEASRIFMVDTANGEFPQEDKDYLSRVVAARTGVNQNDAMIRVNHAIAQADDAKAKAKEAADKARKVAATTALFTFISLLIGAFIACVAAAMGGRHRDELYPVVL
jgi:hypothetical protein